MTKSILATTAATAAVVVMTVATSSTFVSAEPVSTNCAQQRVQIQTNSVPADRIVSWCAKGYLGELPSSFFAATNQQLVNYPNGQVNSTSLAGFSSLTQMLSLTMSGNADVKLSGTIPVNWGAALSELEELDLSNNDLSGSIPTQIGLLVNLRELDLRNNRLNSKLPSELFKLPNLDKLYLDHNEFTGTIPAVFGAKKLSDVGFSQNQLTGCVPISILPAGWVSSEQTGGGTLEICTAFPTVTPTKSPTGAPTKVPDPTASPTSSPTLFPTLFPTLAPTSAPTTELEEVQDDLLAIIGFSTGISLVIIFWATVYIRRKHHKNAQYATDATPSSNSQRNRAESDSKKGMTYTPGKGWVENKGGKNKFSALPPSSS